MIKNEAKMSMLRVYSQTLVEKNAGLSPWKMFKNMFSDTSYKTGKNTYSEVIYLSRELKLVKSLPI